MARRRASRGLRPHQALRRPRRRQGHGARRRGRQNPGPDRTQRLRQIDGDEADHGHRTPDAGSVRINGIDVAGWPSHKIARMGAGIVFQHSRPLHRQTVLENIKLALLPDKLTRLFADPTDRRACTRHRRARRLERRTRPPSGHFAVRRSAQDRNRQGDRAKSAGAVDRRAFRRPDARPRPRPSPI